MFRAHAVGATAAAAVAESRRRENALVVRVSDKLAESAHLRAQSNAVPCNAVQFRAGPGGAMRCRAVQSRSCCLRAGDEVATAPLQRLFIGADVLCAVAPFFKVAAAYNNGLTAAFETLQVATRNT
jgi:hypothetical protein